MPLSLVEAFDQTIERKYRLERNGGHFIVTETAKRAKNRYLKISGGKGVGFTLDQDGRHPWGFIVDSPLAGVVSVCDGILVLEYQNQCYVVVLDLKSNNPGAKAVKQIKSSAYLVSWLYQLLNLHSHVEQSYQCIGLICKSRRTTAKGTSKRTLRSENINTTGDFPIVTVANPDVIRIRDLVETVITL